MDGYPFLLSSPRDMLSKAKRDLAALNTELSADNIFNCFVTVYHVMDYVKVLGFVPKTAIEKMYAEADFEMCKFICNRGKHLNVTRDPKTVEIYEFGGCGMLGFGCIGGGPLGSIPEHHFYCDGQEVFPVQLAERVIELWEKFFVTHGI